MKSQKNDREIYSTFSPLGKRFSRSSNRSRVFVGSSIIMSRGFRKPASSLSFPVLRNHPPRGGKVFLAALKAVEQCYRMQMRLDSVLQAVPPKSKGSGGISERRILAFRHSSPPFGPPLTSLPALLGSISCHREMRFWMDARSSLRFLLCSMFFFLFFLLDKFQSDELVRCSLAFGICF